LTKDYKVNRIYVRDLYQAWYHMGLRQITYDILGIALFLNNLVTRMNAEQIVLIGNSMGGYAAILFGALINATEVHAFSPQTFIDKSNRQKFMDHRWETQLQRVYSNGNPQYFDLEPLICNYKGRCKFKIHFSPLDRLDQLHAEHLKDSSLISLFSYDVGGHNLVRTLRDSGVLEKLIAEVFEENPKRK
jgi:pimeloyl-ACP methyl ester carboxylesterase